MLIPWDCFWTPNLHSGTLVKTPRPAATCSWAQLCMGLAWVNPSSEPSRQHCQQQSTKSCRLPGPASQSLWMIATTHGDLSSDCLRAAPGRETSHLHFDSLSASTIWHTYPILKWFRFECRFSWALRDQSGTWTAKVLIHYVSRVCFKTTVLRQYTTNTVLTHLS